MASKFIKGKNRRLDFMQLQRHINEYVPKVYASIGSELYLMGWSKEEINDLFNKSRERWEQSEREGWDMVQNFNEVTGMNIMYLCEEPIERKV